MITTSEKVINEGNLGTVAETLILPHIEKAELDLRSRIPNYDTISSYCTSSVVTEKRIFDTAVLVETNFAISYALPSLNVQTQGSGLLKSTGWDVSRNELYTVKEILELSTNYYNTGLRFLDQLIPTTDTGSYGRIGYAVV